MKARADAGHEIPDRPPLQLSAGDTVEVSDRTSDWPAFVFVTCDRGAGWVPSHHLDQHAGAAVVVRRYDTTELALTPGTWVTVLERDAEAGWWWCRDDDGREGWVPAESLTLAD